MLPYLVAAIIVIGLPTLYIAVRYREYRKFLAGALFVSSGMQFFCEHLDHAHVDERRPVAAAQPRARDDPLCALSCLVVFGVVLPQKTISLGEAAKHPNAPRSS